MRKKVDLNEYSFFLKAKGETAVTVTIFRKDEKVVSKEFNSLDKVLKYKLNELESYATDKEQAEERIKESEKRLKWLEEIKVQVESILEI